MANDREKRKYVKISGVDRALLLAGDAGACDSPAKIKIKKDAVASFLVSPTACLAHARLVGILVHKIFCKNIAVHK